MSRGTSRAPGEWVIGILADAPLDGEHESTAVDAEPPRSIFDAGRFGVCHCSIGCGSEPSAAAPSCVRMVGAPSSATTAILRGFAFSLTGMVTVSTPLL